MNHDLPLHALDPYRLPRHAVPIRYDLQLEPHLDDAIFYGQETVTVMVMQQTMALVMNAAELQIGQAYAEDAQGQRLQASIELDETLQRCRLSFAQVLAPGVWKLHITFQGTLNDKLRGFYRSTFRDRNGAVHTIAATQFEATDARRAFPCWDEPDFKAVFSTTLVIAPDLKAVSNTEVLSETIVGKRNSVRFADSMKMSTYLVAFIVGCLESTAPRFVGRTPIRLWTVPGKQLLTDFGHDIAIASLQFFEDYYGIPYPGDKLDLLAIPDFSSGAMENLGAITFRETALLVDQRAGTHSELERVADVVAHENAHMWFGDYVTMSWWNGLWLNEAFATFMELLAVDAWKPEWKRWETFCVSRASAFAVDGLQSTRSIEYPVRAPTDADAMFDVLTYEKGASVLRMLEQYLGPSVFREGVHDYLRTHAYGNADTKDLWISIGKVAAQPVPELMDGWIFQPGFPLVTASLDGESELVLSQRRFTYLCSERSLEQLWHIPVRFRVTAGGHTEHRSQLLTEHETRIKLEREVDQIVINEEGHGFYRVLYDTTMLRRLLDAGLDRLAPIERFNVVSDAWAATMAGLMPLEAYLSLTTYFKQERNKNVWAVLLDTFSFLRQIVDDEDRLLLEACVRDRLGPAVEELGWDPRTGDDELLRQLRGELLAAMGKLGNDPQIQEQAVARYREYTRDHTSVDPNVLPALVTILSHTGDEERYEEFFMRFRGAATPQEERRYLFSLVAFRSPVLLKRTLARSISEEIRTQDAPFLVSAAMMNVYGRGQAWEFVKANWDEMDRRFPKQGLRRMCGGVVGLVTPELERDVREFFTARKIDLGGKALDQFLEQLRIAVAFREREGETLRDSLTRSCLVN